MVLIFDLPWLHVRMIQLRCGLMSTKMRKSRGGRNFGDLYCCGGCGRFENLTHILQKCARTHDYRCLRHIETCKAINKMLRRQSVVTLYEPHIPLTTSYCKPHIIAVRNGAALVMDLTICDPGRIAMAWSDKVTKYSTQETNASVLSHLRSLSLDEQSVEHYPIVVT